MTLDPNYCRDHRQGDIVIDFLNLPSEYTYAVGVFNKGIFEWIGKDLKPHRYQGSKCAFKWESALKIVRKYAHG